MEITYNKRLITVKFSEGHFDAVIFIQGVFLKF